MLCSITANILAAIKKRKHRIKLSRKIHKKTNKKNKIKRLLRDSPLLILFQKKHLSTSTIFQKAAIYDLYHS